MILRVGYNNNVYLLRKILLGDDCLKKPLKIGVAASFFFAFTFILNRSMNLSGGPFLWSGSLRYFFMFPLLWIVLAPTGKTKAVYTSIAKNTKEWLIYSTIGFGFFYFFITLASVFGESWLSAALWQLTIICGMLLTPLFGKSIPKRPLLFSVLILLGVFLLQVENATSVSVLGSFIALFSILIAAFSYPLGNRKMMEIVGDGLNTTQRVYGMTLMSLPFWFIVSTVATVQFGLPTRDQLFQSFLVALFSGVIATVLFFKATEMVKDNPVQLGVIEATQCGEVIFTFLIGVTLLRDSLPGIMGFLGLALIIVGMIACAMVGQDSHKRGEERRKIVGAQYKE